VVLKVQPSRTGTPSVPPGFATSLPDPNEIESKFSYLLLDELGPMELKDEAFQDSQLDLGKAKVLRENNSVSYWHRVIESKFTYLLLD
jgi:hypothetical protein